MHNINVKGDVKLPKDPGQNDHNLNSLSNISILNRVHFTCAAQTHEMIVQHMHLRIILFCINFIILVRYTFDNNFVRLGVCQYLDVIPVFQYINKRTTSYLI